MEKQMVIELDRKDNVLRIGKSKEDIDHYSNTIVMYNVTHVERMGIGWYDIFCKNALIGHVSDVICLKERW